MKSGRMGGEVIRSEPGISKAWGFFLGVRDLSHILGTLALGSDTGKMSPFAKSWLIGKDSDAGRDWGQEEKGTTEDEMAGWHQWLDGRESEWTAGVGDGQGGLACCDSWGREESDMTERLYWTELNWAGLKTSEDSPESCRKSRLCHKEHTGLLTARNKVEEAAWKSAALTDFLWLPRSYPSLCWVPAPATPAPGHLSTRVEASGECCQDNMHTSRDRGS